MLERRLGLISILTIIGKSEVVCWDKLVYYSDKCKILKHFMKSVLAVSMNFIDILNYIFPSVHLS